MTDPHETRRPDDPVRALLRAGDPLAGETPPTPVQITAWRTALRDAIRRPAGRAGRARALVPALGIAGAVVVAALLIPGTQPPPVPDTGVTTAPPPIATAPPPIPAPLPTAAPPPPRAPAVPPATPPIEAQPPLVARASRVTPQPAPVRPAGPQSLQFTAANGTRIVWILDPNLNL